VLHLNIIFLSIGLNAKDFFSGGQFVFWSTLKNRKQQEYQTAVTLRPNARIRYTLTHAFSFSSLYVRHNWLCLRDSLWIALIVEPFYMTCSCFSIHKQLQGWQI